jgi:hypothetical protein
MKAVKDIIFFVLIFVFLYFYPQITCLLSSNLKFGQNISKLASATLLTFILVFIFVLAKVGIEKFHFQLPKSAMCEQGLYMVEGDENRYYCENLYKDPNYCSSRCGGNTCGNPLCGKDMIGNHPYNFVRTTMSDDKWKNTMCQCSNESYY